MPTASTRAKASTTAKKPAAAKKPVVAKEAIAPQPEPQEMLYRFSERYRAEIKLIGSEAEYFVLSDADAVVAEGKVGELALSYPGLKDKVIAPLQHGLMEAIAAYNRLFPLESGEVDITQLTPHPYNSMLYDENNALDELERLMILPDFKMDALIVNPEGQVLSGNSRLQVALKLNHQAGAEGKPKPFPTLKVEVESYDSLEAELERIRRGNIYRQKTAQDKKREAAIAARNLVLTSSKVVSTERTKAVAQELGMSQRNVENLVAVEKVKRNLPKPLATKLEKIAQASPRSAAEIAMAEPPNHLKLTQHEYQEAIADEIINSPKRLSSALAKKQVNQRLSLEQNKTEHSDKIEAAIAAGDNPADNRYTPDEFVQLAQNVMGSIYIDAFATVTNPGKVPAIKAYTILDDAWKQSFEKEVFANPPWSRAVEACALLDQWLRKRGGIEKLFLVAPFSILSSEAVHTTIDDFDMRICHPYKRVNYSVGEVLRAVEPDANEKNIRDLTVVLFYSKDDKDYDALARQFPGWVGIRQKAGSKEVEAIATESSDDFIPEEAESATMTTC
jgi:hypothetical protein